MIKVETTKKDNNYNKIIISGHALYDDYGKDIVCSAVSSIVITTINGILTINQDGLKYHQTDNLEIDNISKDEITQKLLINMLNLLQELEEKYPDNIKVK